MSVETLSRSAAVPVSTGRLRAGLAALVATDFALAPLILRLALAVVVFPHGAQKVLGWWGGYGIEGTMGYFASLGLPAVFGALAIASDFLGPLALASGFFGRVAAFGTAMVMLFATLLEHAQYGFFMNWGGNLAGEGYEFHLLGLGIALALMVTGSGALSVDRLLHRRLTGRGEA